MTDKELKRATQKMYYFRNSYRKQVKKINHRLRYDSYFNSVEFDIDMLKLDKIRVKMNRVLGIATPKPA